MSDDEDEAIAIVAAIAEAEPLHFEADYHWCVLCNNNLPISPEDHESTCPWRRAVEFMKGR